MDTTRKALAFVAALALAAATSAQGRHDEKPHGTNKAAQDATISEPKVHPGGRHDEQSHKSAIAAQKKATKKTGEAAKAPADKAAVDKAAVEKAPATPAPATAK